MAVIPPAHSTPARTKRAPWFRSSAISGDNRAATHPINALLNYAFAVAEARIETHAIAKGLDVSLGCLHDGPRGLVYDLVELDRTRTTKAIIDYSVRKRWKRSDFNVNIAGEVRLTTSVPAKWHR